MIKQPKMSDGIFNSDVWNIGEINKLKRYVPRQGMVIEVLLLLKRNKSWVRGVAK